MPKRNWMLGCLAFIVGLSGWGFLFPVQATAQQGIPQGYIAKNMTPIAYLDIEPGFKLAIQEAGSRWYLYMGHIWARGWSIVDVTDPRVPKFV